ncbi:MAG: hypothetical protein IPH20_24235 [Bacteroidales bacterium]|nr:hypothetical protein [Bacteroidales bacterium]
MRVIPGNIIIGESIDNHRELEPLLVGMVMICTASGDSGRTTDSFDFFVPSIPEIRYGRVLSC